MNLRDVDLMYVLNIAPKQVFLYLLDHFTGHIHLGHTTESDIGLRTGEREERLHSKRMGPLDSGDRDLWRAQYNVLEELSTRLRQQGWFLPLHCTT
jgi:hypothetical protein